MKIRRFSFFALPVLALGASLGVAVLAPQTPWQRVALAPATASARPLYNLELDMDIELRTLRGRADVRVPVAAGDPLRDVSLLLLANASAPDGRKHLAVEAVKMNGQDLPFTLDEAVLKVKLPAPQSAPFSIQIAYRGVVPHAGEDKGALGGMLGADVSDMLGGLMGGGAIAGAGAGAVAEEEAETQRAKKTTDYGLYSDGDGILSLGAFWYPQIAVRENGKWADAQPESLGDLAHAEMADFRLRLRVPERVVVVAPGKVTREAEGTIVRVEADNRRDFALVMSERFVSRSKTVLVGGRNVRIESFARRENAGKLNQTLDVAASALQIFTKRFGPYLYDEFKIVESPLRSGAGGMEYSGMTGLASMLYADMGKQLGGMMTTLQLPGAEALLRDLGDESADATAVEVEGNALNDMLGGVLGEQMGILSTLFETTLVHEVAHQWFAIGVGSDSQNHPFVDESLVNWAMILYFEDRYGPERAAQMSDLHLRTNFSMGAMLGGGDKPANLPASAYNNNLQYGAVVYGKGALFYSKLRELVGDEAFFEALRAYYAQYKNGLAGPDDLKTEIIQRVPAKRAQVNALYRRWVEEAHGQEDIGGGGLSDLLGGMGGLGGLDMGGLLGGLE